ncbi:MAG: FAD-binding oxidoreductase [Myxococcota bacterium]|nr:FAD-binding oxidoreductase [Myxococcota bacterium]
MTTRPLWLDPPMQTAGPLDGDTTADICVVGAGICGTAAARALARAGIDVAWVEADRIAYGATGRNAGFILQGTAERYDRAVGLMGRERARRIHGWSLKNHERMAATIAEDEIDCGYRVRGSLQLAGSEREEAELIASHDLLRADGFDAEIVQGAALGDALSQAGFRLGVVLPRDGELHPAAFVRGGARAALQAGARLYEQTRVTTIDAREPGAAVVHTERGDISCAVVVVCVNAWVGRLLPWFADKVDPVRGQMLATAPAPPLFDRPIYADHGYDYWRQDPDGRVVLGGWRNLDPSTEVGYDDALHSGIQERMAAFLERFPGLSDVEVTHRWSGTMGFSRDGLPLVGPAPGSPAALVGAGFTGHGFGFGWLAGEALAAVALEGQHPMATDLSPRRLA